MYTESGNFCEGMTETEISVKVSTRRSKSGKRWEELC